MREILKRIIQYFLVPNMEEQLVFCVQLADELISFRLHDGRMQQPQAMPDIVPFNDTEKEFSICLPNHSSPLGVKDPSFALNLNGLVNELKLLGIHQNNFFDVHQWKEQGNSMSNSRRMRTISEAVSSSSKYVPGQEVGRRRMLSEGQPDITQSYKRGILLTTFGNAQMDIKIEIAKVVEESGFQLNKLVWQNGKLLYATRNGPDLSVQFTEDESLHPAFKHHTCNHVFHSRQDVELSLSNTNESDLKKLKQLLDTCATPVNGNDDDTRKHPFIVVEGLDGTGKSTIVKTLADALAAKHLKTPPESMLKMRKSFDSKPALHRRLYYFTGNYVVAEDIRKALETQPVVMDRFWNSTAAYTIATDCAVGDEHLLPTEGASVYQWPRDLVTPSLVLLLSVSEEERARRLKGRSAGGGPEETPEESRLQTDVLFRKRVHCAYQRMHGLNFKMVEIDADGTQQEVKDRVMQALRESNII